MVLLILFATLAMPVGSTISHGIAAMAHTLSANALLTGISHDREHDREHDHDHDHDHAREHSNAQSDTADDSSLNASADNITAEHPHHGADHSHDAAHTPVAAWAKLEPQPVQWLGQPLRWVETVQQSRLERPPIA